MVILYGLKMVPCKFSANSLCDYIDTANAIGTELMSCTLNAIQEMIHVNPTNFITGCPHAQIFTREYQSMLHFIYLETLLT